MEAMEARRPWRPGGRPVVDGWQAADQNSEAKASRAGVLMSAEPLSLRRPCHQEGSRRRPDARPLLTSGFLTRETDTDLRNGPGSIPAFPVRPHLQSQVTLSPIG
jgi:hypothetical protein